MGYPRNDQMSAPADGNLLACSAEPKVNQALYFIETLMDHSGPHQSEYGNDL